MNATENIDNLIAQLGDWRGQTIADIRRIIHEADPEIIEEWKWRGAPVFSHSGIVCLAGAFKDKVKLTFYDGASLADPDKLFNAELEGNKWRAIDFFKNGQVRGRELTNLVRAAVAHNVAKAKNKAKTGRTRKKTQSTRTGRAVSLQK